MLDQLRTDRESERKIRHENNNRLAAVLGAMSKDVSEIGDQQGLAAGTIAELRIELRDAVKQIVELDHVVRGVDGNNGLRADVKLIKESIRFMEIRIAMIAAALAGAGVWAGKMLF